LILNLLEVSVMCCCCFCLKRKCL